MMKRTTILVVVLLTLMSLVTYAKNVEITDPLWQYKDLKIEQKTTPMGRSVVIDLVVAPDQSLKSKEVMIVQLAFASKDRTSIKPIATYQVAGKNRLMQFRRNVALNNEVPHGFKLEEIQSLEAMQQSPLNIHAEFPFEEWMKDGEVIATEKVYGCATCEVRFAEGVLGVAELPVFTPDLDRLKYHTPAKVDRKAYEEEFTSFVTFAVARHELVPNFNNNQQELGRIDDFIAKALKLSEIGATIGEVQVIGYASPEGNFDRNKSLSERRANTLSQYVSNKYRELRSTARFNVVGGGEDWAGLRRNLASSNEAYANDVVAIIEKYPTDLEREKDIKAMQGGAVYRSLLDNYYPPLRRTVFRMKYDVRPYTVEELPKIYAQKPELLGHDELATLAQVYYVDKGQSPLEVLRYAYERFGKKDKTAALNYAVALLRYEESKPFEVLTVLEGLEATEEVTYMRAIAYHRLGNEEKVFELLDL